MTLIIPAALTERIADLKREETAHRRDVESLELRIAQLQQDLITANAKYSAAEAERRGIETARAAIEKANAAENTRASDDLRSECEPPEPMPSSAETRKQIEASAPRRSIRNEVLEFLKVRAGTSFDARAVHTNLIARGPVSPSQIEIALNYWFGKGQITCPAEDRWLFPMPDAPKYQEPEAKGQNGQNGLAAYEQVLNLFKDDGPLLTITLPSIINALPHLHQSAIRDAVTYLIQYDKLRPNGPGYSLYKQSEPEDNDEEEDQTAAFPSDSDRQIFSE